MKKSLKVQLAVVFIIVAVMLIGSCWVANHFLLDDYYIREKQHQLMDTYESVNKASSDNTLSSESYSIELQNMLSRSNISLLVVDSEYNLVFSSVNEENVLEQRLLENIFSQKQETDDKTFESSDKYSMRLRRDWFLRTEYLELWGTLDNGNNFIMRTPIESIRESAAASERLLAYIGIAVGLIGVLIIVFFAGKITRPIKDLSEVSKKMSAMDFSARYTGKEKNEIGVLGNNINEMSDNLERAISELKSANLQLMNDIEERNKVDEMRKEFIANVTHELKTPIALIQGYAEGLQECINDDPESRDFYCDVIIDESAKMNTMVKKLLTLSRMEFGDQKLEMTQFDIVALIKGVVQNQELLMEQKNVKLKFDDTQSYLVWGDEFDIEEVVSNYVSNAVNHVDGDMIIDIKVIPNEEHDKVKVSVFNTGSEIPEDSIDRVWEKFYKVDKAHTREYGGSGIGLSIVKAIMDSHQQAYGVQNWDNGVEFWFELSTR